MKRLLITVLCSFFLFGCAGNLPPLGSSVSSVAQAQTYNPEAAKENSAIIPEGNGERLENVYQTYTSDKKVVLKGTESRVVEGVSSN
ncbi:hypothetical protein L4C34_09055 [Vibrio profundum]|uniref:hypothetical protein n=1 Tax=Vibrio profundum TaxID=2910247 RepID=UPI003D1532BF